MFKVVAAAVINIFIITFFCLLEVGLVWIHLAHQPLFGLLLQPWMRDDDAEQSVDWVAGETHSTWKKLVPMPLCPYKNHSWSIYDFLQYILYMNESHSSINAWDICVSPNQYAHYHNHNSWLRLQPDPIHTQQDSRIREILALSINKNYCGMGWGNKTGNLYQCRSQILLSFSGACSIFVLFNLSTMTDYYYYYLITLFTILETGITVPIFALYTCPEISSRNFRINIQRWVWIPRAVSKQANFIITDHHHACCTH
jgi:hypothetical protein